MKIAVYGISCAGKDTFISEFIQKFPEYRQIKGSTKLNEITDKKFHCSFEEIDVNAQEEIRKLLIDELKEMSHIVVDGHYCFPEPESASYQTVFTDSDKDCYDIFIYLKIPPHIILDRIKESKKNSKYDFLNEDAIEKWQQKEIVELRDICFNEYKEFIVLDTDDKNRFLFLEKYFCVFPRMKSVEISKRIAEKIITECNENKKVALFDCDRTVIKEDTTIPFFELNGEDSKPLKEIFSGDVYSAYQFWRQQEIYKGFMKYPCVENFHFNTIVIDKLKQLQKTGFRIYGFTSGVYKIWNDINETYHLFYTVIGTNLPVCSYEIVTDCVKGFVARILKESGYNVFSTGDSMCDIYMLECTGGYIWAPGKLRSAVQNYINTHPNTSIKQYNNNPDQYKGIKEGV